MRSGDDEGFQAFAVARTAYLFRTALLLSGGDWHQAEDLVQETLAKIYLSWRRVDKNGNPAGYAQTTLVRTFISQKRLKSSGEVPVAEFSQGAGHGEDSTLRVTLIDALSTLSPRDRALVVMRYWEDRSVEETAGVLGMNRTTVRVQCKRALAKLRTVLGDAFPELIAG